ncbi:MAG: hypothetical protein ACP6IQ_02605 [Candidatus Njordarchaeia archaeon]
MFTCPQKLRFKAKTFDDQKVEGFYVQLEGKHYIYTGKMTKVCSIEVANANLDGIVSTEMRSTDVKVNEEPERFLIDPTTLIVVTKEN